MRLEDPSAPYRLRDVQWDAETLRVLIQRMLRRNNLTPADLIAAWDTSGDGVLDKCEILSAVRHQSISTSTQRCMHVYNYSAHISLSHFARVSCLQSCTS